MWGIPGIIQSIVSVRDATFLSPIGLRRNAKSKSHDRKQVISFFFSLRHDLRCQRAPMNSGFCRITPDGWLRAGIIRLDVIERIGCVSAFLAYWHTTDYQLYFSCVSHKSNLARGRYVENCSCTGNHSPILLHKRQGKCNKSEPHLYEVIRVDRINNCKPHQKLRVTFFLD